MDDTQPEFLTRADGIRLAYHHVAGAGPTIIFLPGYMSDMNGSKALALHEWAVANGRAILRLDYSGCGQSQGRFADSSFDIWRDDVLLAIRTRVDGPVLLVGSSMGGWLMLMVAEALGKQVAGVLGIAAAPDFTDWGFTDAQRATIMADGVLLQDNPYGPGPTPTYRTLFSSGERLRMLDRTIATDCPVRLLHGQCDTDVPWQISVKLAAALRSSDVHLTLVKDGDHRLSRNSDIALLLDILSRFPV
jgi:pimeloyl-ACP methyl ester carboxylesterase